MRGACKSCGKPVAQPHHNLCPECFRKAGGRASGPSDRGRPERHARRELPEGYLQRGYRDDGGRLHREIVIDWAREIAVAPIAANVLSQPNASLAVP